MGYDRLRHDKIVKTIKPCKKSSEDKGVKCVSRLKDLTPGALRARTTTSAGMNNVITGDARIDKNNAFNRIKNKQFVQQYFKQDQLWEGLSVVFAVSREEAQFARTTLVQRMQEIAEDNLKGQW